jgi:hypothetical protein
MTDMAATCHCGSDAIGHVHTREPRRTRDIEQIEERETED